MALRIAEYKEWDEHVMRLELLDDELSNYPPVQIGREQGPIKLLTFLKHVQATLCTHPLYSFYKWNITDGVEGNRNNVRLESWMGDDKDGDLKFIFSDKARKILQRNSSTLLPIEGLQNVLLNKELALNYPPSFTCFVTSGMVAYSVLGSGQAQVLKTIQLNRNRNNKVEYSKHFKQLEYHNCDRFTPTYSIRMNLHDKNGEPLSFLDGEMCVTLHCIRNSQWATDN